MATKTKKTVCLSLAFALFAGLLLIEIFNAKIFGGIAYGELYYSIATRFMGGFACMIFIYAFSYPKMLRFGTSFKHFLIFLPCMAVAVNNFPFITFFTGEAYINSTPLHVALYALSCIF